ncbi:hypothetical protein JCM18899A_43120 [Nocardioides sp. AN3]
MSSTDTRQPAASEAARSVRTRDPLFASVVGLTALVILLQGLWAGLFIREGRDFDASSSQSMFVQVHDWGGRAAILLALVSLVVAVWRLRSRPSLIVGTAALLLLVMLEGFLGGGIGDHPSWPGLHIPLAMGLMALSVWLPLRAARDAEPVR